MWWKATTSTRSPWVCGSTEFFPPAPEIIPPKWAHQRLEPKWPEAKAWWPTSTFTALSLQHFMLFHNTVPTQIPWRNVPYVSQHLSRGTTCFPFFLNALVCVLCILERYYCTPPPPPPHPTPPGIPIYETLAHLWECLSRMPNPTCEYSCVVSIARSSLRPHLGQGTGLRQIPLVVTAALHGRSASKDLLWAMIWEETNIDQQYLTIQWLNVIN